MERVRAVENAIRLLEAILWLNPVYFAWLYQKDRKNRNNLVLF